MAVEYKPGVVPGKPWFSTEAGKYEDSEMAARHYDDEQLTIRRARMTRAEDEEFDRMVRAGDVSTDTAKINRQIQRLTDEALEGRERQLTRLGAGMLVKRWIEAHPNYIDSEYNGGQFRTMLIADTGSPIPRDDAAIDATMEKLARAGILQLVEDVEKQKKMSDDEKYVATQLALQRKGAAQASPEPQRAEPTEEELYTMPMDELRRGSGGFHPLGPRG